MTARQRPRPSGVIDGDWQLFETLTSDGAGNVEDYSLSLGQLASVVLDGYLPR